VSAGGLGKAPHLQRVDLGERQAGFSRPAFKAVVVRPGWLKDDAGNAIAAKPANECLDPLGIVGELTGVARRVKVHIERRFADVDAVVLRSEVFDLFEVLCLSCGHKARVSAQATGKEKGDHSR
jgi:hypothetical protein